MHQADPNLRRLVGGKEVQKRAFLIAAAVLVGGLVSARNDRLIFEITSVKPNNSGTTIANGGGIARNRRHLRWAPQPPTGARDATSPEIGPSIFTALEEQLGLKLQSARAPIEVLVIDSIELPTRDYTWLEKRRISIKRSAGIRRKSQPPHGQP